MWIYLLLTDAEVPVPEDKIVRPSPAAKSRTEFRNLTPSRMEGFDTLQVGGIQRMKDAHQSFGEQSSHYVASWYYRSRDVNPW